MTTRCCEPADLLLHAIQLPGDREARDVARHVNGCASCQATVNDIRESAGLLQSSQHKADASGQCLDEMAIANIVEQGVIAANSPETIAHLAACARCREQLTSVASLLRDASIGAEMQRTEVPATTHGARRWRIGGAATLAALAAAVTFMFAESSDRATTTTLVADTPAAIVHREKGVTTTVAPNLITPVGASGVPETFSWTSVPHADRYRLTVFDREGKTVWQAETSDTAIATPKSVIGERSTTYLWKVEARTGWDRWVASELLEFSVSPAGRVP